MQKETIEKIRKYQEEFRCTAKTKIKIKPHFLKIESYQCNLQNGKRIIREKIIKGKTDGSAVTILPITEEGKIILIMQPRVFTKETVGIELPAGYIESKETPLEAAQRELLEETGFKPTNAHLFASFYQDQGCSAALNYSVIATGCQKVRNQQLDVSEYIHYLECTWQEVEELVDKGYITDLQSQFTIAKAKIYRKEKDK